MTNIRSEFFVELHGVSCTRDVLGRTIVARRSDFKLKIEFPTTPDCFEFVHMGAKTSQSTEDPREYRPSVAIVVHGNDLVEIRLVRVVVNAEFALSVDDFNPLSEADKRRHDEIFFRFREAALDFAQELSEWVSLELGQTWIEPTGQYPSVVNAAGLVDIQAGKRFGVLIAQGGRLRVLADETILKPESFNHISLLMQGGKKPAAEQILLAEALFLVEGEQRTGPDRAVLLAAMAVELHVKRVLRLRGDARSTVGADRRMVARKSDGRSPSAHKLFRKALLNFPSGTLPQGHRILARRVQLLFELRNDIVHDGVTVKRADARLKVKTAREALSLLSALEPASDS